MSLPVGTTLGPYEILALVGKGGMGEVYRAHDPRLKRDVAVKVSAAQFSERFEREAQAIAALNHSNICHLYDVGENYLVMEFVEGETLRGPMPVPNAIRVALQIAEAVEYAHEHGIVHRDLKPANIKITPEGSVKVLDFGLAKALEDPGSTISDPGNSPTLTIGATRAGVILGTAGYMSPEQAHGKTADRRADIFSFGAVLYEMLTGKQAFTGESVGDTLASVLKLDPDWNALPAETPATVRTLLQRCLTKDRKQRLQAIGEARIALESPLSSPARQTPPAMARPRVAWTAAFVFAMIAVIAIWEWLKSSALEPRVVTHFTTAFPATTPTPSPITISRDGSRVAYVADQTSKIYVRAMDQLEAKPIDGTDGAMMLCFSPDGQWISYISSLAPPVRLRKVAISGGPVQNLADLDGFASQSWAADDNIYLASASGIQRIPSTGGKPDLLLASGKESYSSPQLLPNGRRLLYSIESRAGSRTAVLDLKSREKKVVLENAPGDAKYGAGHLVYYVFSSGTLMALPFDADRLTTHGSPVPVVEQVQFSIGALGPYAFSESGTLVYAGGAVIPIPPSTLVWVDRKGTETALSAPPQRYGTLRLSPDGTRAAVAVTAGQLTFDVWVYDLARGGNPSRVTFDGGSAFPVWSGDSKRLFYFFFRIPHFEVRSVAADNSGMPVTLLSIDNDAPLIAESASLDGKVIIGRRSTQGGSAAWQLPLQEEPGKAKLQPLLDPRPNKTMVRFSPDGKWIAYSSNESGRDEVYVVPYPDSGGRSQVSLEGGNQPHWAHSGRELFYRNGDKLMSVDIETSPSFRAGTPKVLFEKQYVDYDVARDDNRFLILKPVPGQQGQQTSELHIIANWFEELRRRVPTGR